LGAEFRSYVFSHIQMAQLNPVDVLAQVSANFNAFDANPNAQTAASLRAWVQDGFPSLQAGLLQYLDTLTPAGESITLWISEDYPNYTTMVQPGTTVGQLVQQLAQVAGLPASYHKYLVYIKIPGYIPIPFDEADDFLTTWRALGRPKIKLNFNPYGRDPNARPWGSKTEPHTST